MRKISLLLGLVAMLLIAGCIPSFSSKEEGLIQDDEQSVEETVVIPDIQLKDNYYRTLLPFKKSASRGLIINNIQTKYDIQEVEEGLLRLSTEHFDPANHFFQEGQYIDEDTAISWLGRKSADNEAGLNPEATDENADEVPNYLAHIVEQNYLVMTDEKKVKLGGISVALALNSVHYSKNGTETQISDKVLEEQGAQMGAEIVKRLREKEGLADIPIVIGLFKQENQKSIAPGYFFATTFAEKGSAPSGLKLVDEKYVLFPAQANDEKYREIDTSFRNFKKEIDDYFPSFINTVGRGLYKNGAIDSLEIEIPIEFFGTSEIIGFTQNLSGLVVKHFPNVRTEVSVTSLNGPEALIVKGVGDDTPFVHMYGYLKDEFYTTLQPFEKSASRGLIRNNIYTKYDMQEVEKGLLRLSTQHFALKNHYFQEGQYIDEDTARSWLRRKSPENKEGLNPQTKDDMTEDEIAEKAPNYLAHIVEQNYFTVTDGKKGKLEGISIALALNSIYYTRDGKETKISDKVLAEKGTLMGEEIVKRLRAKEELANVPIVVGLYKQEKREAIVPGHFFATSLVEKGKVSSGWKQVDEHYALFPSKDNDEKHRELDTSFRNFKQSIEEYFPSFVNTVGRGFYKNGTIHSLEIEIPIQFFGTSETIGFTQYLTGLVVKYFPNVHTEVSVKSINGPEALIVKDVGDDSPYVYKYGY